MAQHNSMANGDAHSTWATQLDWVRVAEDAIKLTRQTGWQACGGKLYTEDDIAQEIRLRLLERRVQARYLPEKGSRLAYAIGVALRVRRECARAERRLDPARGRRAGGERVIREPADAAMVVEDIGRLKRAIDSLDRDDADLVKRRYEIGRRGFQRPLTSRERSRLCRALRRLRVMLAYD